MNYPTASKLGLAHHCTAWVSDEHDGKTSEAAQTGIAFHAMAEDYIAHKLFPHIDGSKAVSIFLVWVEWYKMCGLQDSEWIVPELVMGYNGVPMIRGDIKDRKYPNIPAIWGTADFVAMREDHVIVGDWKTGEWTAAEHNRQIRFLGSLAAVAYGKPCIASIFGCTEEGVVESTITIELGEAQRFLQDTWLDVHKPQMPFAGNWCHEHYCPSRGKCKAFKDYLDCVQPPEWAGCSGAEVREFLAYKSAQEAYIKARTNEVKAEVDKVGAIDLGDGREYGVSVSIRPTLDKDLLKMAFGDISGCYVSSEVSTYKAKKRKK